MAAYYNEVDPYCAEWLRNLIRDGLIAHGDVDERSIEAVQPDDVRGYTQCHWFAGIGGWSLALRMAGYGDSEPVWTGSCPCQPFSMAGEGAGTDDPRHLWPAWFRLIKELRPGVVFGEQSASKDGLYWLDIVHADMEAEGYALGPCDLPACGVGAPHGRARLYFVGERGRSDADSRDEFRRPVVVEVGRLWRSAEDAALPVTPRGVWATEPRPSALAYGVSGRMGQLRAYGNAIVPQVAAEFIAAYLDSR